MSVISETTANLERTEGGDGEVFDDKQVVVLGERDGIAGGAIEACVKAAGGTVAFAATECFV